MPKSSKKIPNVVIWLLILISYIPMLTIFSLGDGSRVFMYEATGFWLFVFLFLKFPTISVSSLKQSKIIRSLVFVGLTTVVFLMILKYFGFSFNFALTKVYEIRAKYVAMRIPLAGYLFNWVAGIVNPILFAIFIVKKKWVPLILVLFLQSLLFSVTGHKIFIFVLPFVLALLWVVRRRNPFAWLAMGLTGVILLGMLSYWLANDLWISSLFIRRTFFVPAQLSFFYYDFFSNNSYTFLSQHHIFRSFSDYPYHVAPPNLIAEVYFNKPELNANNGLVADAYMNFGLVGLVLWAVILTMMLKFMDASLKGKDSKIGIAGVAMAVLVLTNCALLTSLLTHGLLLALLLLYLLPKEKLQKS